MFQQLIDGCTTITIGCVHVQICFTCFAAKMGLLSSHFATFLQHCSSWCCTVELLEFFGLLALFDLEHGVPFLLVCANALRCILSFLLLAYMQALIRDYHRSVKE